MHSIPRRALVGAALAAWASVGALSAHAQPAAFPSRPITIIVPASPGGILDQTSRLVASELTRFVNQPVLVENKAGAGQIIGMQALVRAEPDGHTLVMGSIGPNAANYGIYPKLSYAPGDFSAIAHVVSMPNVLLAHPSVQADNVTELVAMARARPGALILASSGTATSGHLAAEMLKMRAGIELTHVPYKGSTPALTDLVGGQVHLMVDNLITALPQVRAGKLKALAVTSAQRVPELPNVPTIAESGYPGFDVTVWVGLMAHSRTPPERVAALHTEIARVLALPHVKKRLADMGGASQPWSPAQFDAFIRSEIDKWGQVVRQAGIRAE